MNCQEVQLAAMALMDCEEPPLSLADIGAHLATCATCQQELKDLQELARLWSSQSRQSHGADVWPQLAGRLAALPGEPLPGNSAWSERRWPAVLAAALIVFKLCEFIPDRRLGIWVQFLPLVLAAALFRLLGQNPFQIKTELPSHKEST
jgi:hypothetical protein